MRWPAVPLSNISPEINSKVYREQWKGNPRWQYTAGSYLTSTWSKSPLDTKQDLPQTPFDQWRCHVGLLLPRSNEVVLPEAKARRKLLQCVGRILFFFLSLSFEFLYMQFVIQSFDRSSNKSLNRLSLNPHEYFLVF